MASMASMASLASSFAKAKTGSNRLHGEKSTKGETIVQIRFKNLVVATSLWLQSFEKRASPARGGRWCCRWNYHALQPHLDPFLHGNWKENKENRPDNQLYVVRLSVVATAHAYTHLSRNALRFAC